MIQRANEGGIEGGREVRARERQGERTPKDKRTLPVSTCLRYNRKPWPHTCERAKAPAQLQCQG